MAKELPHVTEHHRILTSGKPPEREDWVTGAYLIEQGYAAGTPLKNFESPEPYAGIANWTVLPMGHEYVAQIEHNRQFLPKLWKAILALLGALALLAAVYSAVAS